MISRTFAALLLSTVAQAAVAIGPVSRTADGPSPVPKSTLSAADVEAGWISLFDGQSLFGWKANSDLNWSVRDGVIRADKGKPGLLLTTFRLADYELRCDYRLAPGGNSGLFLRTPREPQDPNRDCYELNLCDSHAAFPTGSIVGRAKADHAFRDGGRWTTVVVRAEGRRIRATFDGRPVLDFADRTPGALRVGHIGLQMNGGAIEFRNVALRPLGMSELFDGRDLAGWRVVPDSKSSFDVERGTIHVAGGPGFLETEKTHGDFALQFDARTNAPRLNSGVFLRAMRGTAREPSNGYEVQIHNGFRDGDRSRPIDAGTGAIYRRTKARWVIPDDGAWFTATVIANGDHFAVWVNGIQVTDWTDPRSPDPNPRLGRRTDAGHISLQGHDPSTNLGFRRLRIAEIAGA